MTELIGKTLGSYQILEQLGRGGMADVYKAYQPSLDRYVAVKVMTLQLTREPDFPERFEREAKAVAQLEHPNILAVYDYGRQDEGSYIVMRYVEGGTLSDSMGVPLEMDRITKLMDQISSALHYAHENGVIHRDVKPSNVLLDRGDWPLLTDFGVARMVGASHQLTATGVGIGTPAYMSPEQGLGEKVDRRSDIYSLGVVLYQMLTGNLPFEAETPLAVVMKHIYDPLPIPSQVNPSIPQSVERVVLKAMAKSADDRFQTAEEFSETLRQAVLEAEQDGALDRYAGGAPTTVAAGEQPALEPGRKKRRRLLWLAPVGVGVLLVGLLLGSSLIGFPGASEEPTPDVSPISIVESATEVPATSVLPTAPVDTQQDIPVEATPQPSTRSSDESAVSHDDFGDPSFEGSINPDKWVDQSDPTCSANQQLGKLKISNEPSQVTAHCRLHLPMRDLPTLSEINLLENAVWIASDHSERSSEHSWSISADDLSQGSWYALCGVAASGEGAIAFIEVRNISSELYRRNIQISFDTWHTVSLEVDPETQEISCYADGLPVGSIIPDVAEELIEAPIRVQLTALRQPESRATVYIDDVRVDITSANDN